MPADTFTDQVLLQLLAMYQKIKVRSEGQFAYKGILSLVQY